MKVRQHPSAGVELDEAMAWYAQRSSVAAEGLWQEVKHARRLIVAFPLSAPKISRSTHRFILHGFPYDIVYCIKDEEIFIIAYAHHKRRPGYWRDRLKDMQ